MSEYKEIQTHEERIANIAYDVLMESLIDYVSESTINDLSERIAFRLTQEGGPCSE